MFLQLNTSNIEEISAVTNWLTLLDSPENSFVFKTSGSTGVPKEVSFSLSQIEISVRQTQKAFGLSQTDSLLCPFSMNYVAAKMMAARAHFLKCLLVYTGPTRDPFEHLDEPVSFVALVPLQLEAVLENKTSTNLLNQANNIIVGGAPMSTRLIEAVKTRITAPLYQTYGMTETLTHVALKRVNGGEDELFHALPGVNFRVDVENRLQIQSPLSPEWISTNDVVRLHSPISFEWLGRHDWVINSGGFKVHPESVEKQLSEHFSAEFALSGVEDVEMGQKVVLISSDSLSPKGLREKLSFLHRYEVPKYWLQLDVMPILANGKIDRRALAKSVALAKVDGTLQDIS